MTQALDNQIRHTTSSARLRASQEMPISCAPLPTKYSYFTMILFLGICGLILVQPMFFGAVHALPRFLFLGLTFILIALVCLRGGLASVWGSSVSSPARTVLLLILVFALWQPIQYLALSLTPSSHPVLGQISRILQRSTFVNSSLEIFAFVACLILGLFYCGSTPAAANRLTNLVCATSFIIALCALAHWLSDNGKLFGLFEPDYVIIVNRSRWPFVNPNHLAAFELPGAFLCLALLQNQIQHLKDLLNERGLSTKRPATLSSLLLSKRLQKSSIYLIGSFSILLVILIAVAATLSRGGWLGLAVGVIFYLTLDTFFKLPALAPVLTMRVPEATGAEVQEEPAQKLSSKSARRLRSKKVANTSADEHQALWRYVVASYRPIMILFGALAIYFFMNEQGRELLEGRLEYGLVHSKDDARWELYQSSFPMLVSALPIGLGAGAWASLFPSYMPASLAGVNPMYLHSDPYQALIEFGLPGFITLLLLVTFLLKNSLAALTRIPQSPARRSILALSAGLLGLLVCSAIDFPFHIPAIPTLVAFLLSVLCHNLAQTHLPSQEGST